MADAKEIYEIGGREVAITRPDKVLFPDDGITKRDLVTFYRRIAPLLLPHLEDRPLTLERYPDGIGHPPLYQKSASKYFPDWIPRAKMPKSGGTVAHVICNDEATLAYLANQACITPHVWVSRADQPFVPDQMVFDLDPSDEDFGVVKDTARSLKRLLDARGMPAFLKTSGSRGLHIVVPLVRNATTDVMHGTAHRVAQELVKDDPDHRTLEFAKADRGTRVYIDINRNGWAQMVAPAYVVRARRGAPVSLPIEWNELDNTSLKPDGWTMRTVFETIEKRDDPWKGFRSGPG